MVSHIPNDCEPTTGTWSYHVGHWYVLTVPYHPVVHGIYQTQIIVQQVEDMRQSVEKMVRIKQTLNKARKQKEEITNSTKVTDKEFAGPFVKRLDEALQSFNIHRQQYLGGVLVGNHIHKTL